MSYSAQQVRANLARFKTVALLSDSVGTPTPAIPIADNYFDRVAKAVNERFSPGSFVGATCLDDTIGEAQCIVRFGTITNGFTGPLGASKVLASGAGFAFVDVAGLTTDVKVWYCEHAGAGTLELLVNGVSVGTISTAGTGGEKRHSFPAAPTSRGAVFTLRSNAGTSDVTGIVREGTKSLVRVPSFIRISGMGYGTTRWTTNPAMLASAIAHTKKDGAALLVLSLGGNDAFNPTFCTTPAAFETNLATIADAFLNDGVEVVAIGPARLGWTWPIPSPGAVYEDYAAAFQRVCDVRKIDYENYDQILFADRGFLQPMPDNAHPTAAGHLELEQILGGLLSRARFL